MSKGKTLVAALLVLALALAFGLAACGSSSDDTADAAATAVSGSAAERAATILGHEPTGVAKEIVDKGTVVVANDANYAPQSSIDEATGELVGFDVDVAKKMAELLGLQVQFENPAWETIPAALNQGRYDVSIGSMTITAARDKTLDFTQPYYYASGQVFVKEGGPQIAGRRRPRRQERRRRRRHDLLRLPQERERRQGQDVRHRRDAFPDLQNGNLDFVMTAGPTGQQAILEGKPFEFSGKPLYYEDLAFAVAEGEADWVELLDYSITTMHEDGSLTEMSKKWYNGLDLTVK